MEKEMVIELKGVKFFERMSEETNAFVADVYVNGKKCGYAKNDGHGGNTYVSSYPNQRGLFEKAEKYCKMLPDETWDYLGETHSIKSDIEVVVDQLFESWLKDKDTKKMEKKMETRLMWGVPNGFRYTEVNFKKPLNQIDKTILQGYLNKYKKDFKQGEVFLNTNLQGFNI